MTIDLTADEITMLDTALVEWQNAPGRDGMLNSIMTSIFRPKEDRGGVFDDHESSLRNKIEHAHAEVRKRELQAMRLRLKLYEISQRPGEFESQPKP